ncbi:MAG: response regulator, partial [Gammaproteobacteria bacterium]|nr:response regulator [Gammaproteobacteria bacterium]
MNPAHILVVDDEPDICTLVKDILEDEGYDVTTAQDAKSARDARRHRRPDLVLLDIWMPDSDGISLLKEWAEEDDVLMPVIMISGHGTIETAVEATRLGAWDYLEKPLSLSKLVLTVERALETDKLQKENISLLRRAQPVSEPIGKSKPMQSLREQIIKVALHDTCVLITGEAGSGKRVAAHYLHSNSARKSGPYVEINVATIARENSAM